MLLSNLCNCDKSCVVLIIKFQAEDDELELALALSLLEVKDQQLPVPTHESQPGRNLNQRGRLQPPADPRPAGSNKAPTDGRKTQHLPQTSCWGKLAVSATAANRQAELQKSTAVDNKETPNTSQSVCVSGLSASSTHHTVREDNMIEKADLDHLEDFKRSKRRRQRRKGGCHQVVGLPCTPSGLPPVLMWFRRDLRLCDNPALIGSLELGAPVIPVFIWSPEEEEGPGVTVAVGGACKLVEEVVKSLHLRCPNFFSEGLIQKNVVIKNYYYY